MITCAIHQRICEQYERQLFQLKRKLSLIQSGADFGYFDSDYGLLIPCKYVKTINESDGIILISRNNRIFEESVERLQLIADIADRM